MVCSSIMRVKQALFSMGSGAHLRALEALGYFIIKYASVADPGFPIGGAWTH